MRCYTNIQWTYLLHSMSTDSLLNTCHNIYHISFSNLSSNNYFFPLKCQHFPRVHYNNATPVFTQPHYPNYFLRDACKIKKATNIQTSKYAHRINFSPIHICVSNLIINASRRGHRWVGLVVVWGGGGFGCARVDEHRAQCIGSLTPDRSSMAHALVRRSGS